MKIATKIISTLVVLASSTALLLAQPGYDNFKNQINVPDKPMGMELSNSVVLAASVMMNVKATSYLAIFSTIQHGERITQTDSLLNKRIDAFVAKLKTMGISEKDINLDFISLVPTYNVEVGNKIFSTTANEVPTGFEMKKNVHVLFANHSLLDKIITSAAQSEIYDLVKVDYNVNRIGAAYDTLRIAARKVIEQKRKMYLQIGLDASPINLTEGYNSTYPSERYTSYTAYRTGVSKSDAKKIAKAGVAVDEENKNTTVYYDMIPYNQFDMVLNPDNAEPAVQFCYTLKVRYEISPKEMERTSSVIKPILTSKIK